jgi:DNA-binding winged helix-turn-helix (wHTH) protein/TolB-like protein/Tfp pilus assembly protein PilF
MSGVTGKQETLKTSVVHSSGFRLGVVDVDPGTGTVTGPGGSVQLDPKVMEVLVCLVEADDEVVSREILMTEVWGDVIVTDFALSRCIYQLRKKLMRAANSDETPIETLTKRGYRLSWPVGDTVPEQTNAKKGQKRIITYVAGLGLLLLVAVSWWVDQDRPVSDERMGSREDVQSIRLVVYPFEDLSEKQDQQVFATGLAREVLHELAVVPGLSLIGRSSSFKTGPKNQNNFEHAQLLGADFLLEGSVQAIGSSRRVLVDLHSVPSGEQLWSHSYLIEPEMPFHFLQGVAWEVVQLFQFSMNPESIRASTEKFEAFESYLLAFETQSIEVKRSVLHRAVQLDPNFARAWDGLAAIEVMPVWNGETTVEEAWERSRPFVEKALEIDPGLPEAYVTLGRFKREFGDFDEAIELFQKALELDPGNRWASANLGLVLRFTGHFEEALAIFKLDVAMDPLDAASRTRLGTIQWFMENHEEAERQYKKAVELAPDNEEIYDSWSAMLALGMGRFDLALTKMHQKMQAEGQPTPRTLIQAASWAEVMGLDQLTDRYLHQAGVPSLSGDVPLTKFAARFLERGEESVARGLALQHLEALKTDAEAHLILGALDLKSGQPEQFLQRVQNAFPEYQVPNTRIGLVKDMETILLIAAANYANGRLETAEPLLKATEGFLKTPRSREHYSLAAIHAMRGETELALSELRVSPPGWVRQHARFMMWDPRFFSLHDSAEFQMLVTAHIAALEQQRDSFLKENQEIVATLH